MTPGVSGAHGSAHGRAQGGGAGFTVLFVCTGNICRSPLAERATRARLVAADGQLPAALHIVSAGTAALVGQPMHPASARALELLGGDPAGACAQQLNGPLAAAADLVLTMTREHRAEALGRAPRQLARTFTLREAAALIALEGTESAAGDGPVQRARAVVRGLAAARAHRRSTSEDDIPDPIGQSDAVHEAVGRMIVDEVDVVVRRLLVAFGAPAGMLG